MTDSTSFTSFYWGEQLNDGGLVLGLTVLGGLGGAALYGLARPRAVPPATIAATR